MQWDRQKEGRPALEASGGSLMVRGCEFQQDKLQIVLGEPVRRAVITHNLFTGQIRITNRSQGSVIINNNAADTN